MGGQRKFSSFGSIPKSSKQNEIFQKSFGIRSGRFDGYDFVS